MHDTDVNYEQDMPLHWNTISVVHGF